MIFPPGAQSPPAPSSRVCSTMNWSVRRSVYSGSEEFSAAINVPDGVFSSTSMILVRSAGGSLTFLMVTARTASIVFAAQCTPHVPSKSDSALSVTDSSSWKEHDFVGEAWQLS